MDMIPIWLQFLLTVGIIMLAIEAGYWLGQRSHRNSDEEKESPVSAISGVILGLLAFILAFTFGMTSDRFDARKALVRTEANAIRTSWMRADFLPQPQRDEAKLLLIDYIESRVKVVEARDLAELAVVVNKSVTIQHDLWAMAQVGAAGDMNSDQAALYFEALNQMNDVHSLRVSLGLQSRLPSLYWFVLYALVILGMFAVGYQAAIAGSRRSWVMLVLAISFSIVITLIVAMDQPQSGLIPVSQQPLENIQQIMLEESGTP